MPGRTLPFQLGQSSTAIKNSTGWPAAMLVGDNPTPGYIHFPAGAPGWQWIFPYTYGFAFPIWPPSMAPVTVTTKDTPAGFPAAPAYTQLAQLALSEDPMPPSVGTRAPGAQGPIQYLGAVAFPGTLLSPIIPPGTIAVMIRNVGAQGLSLFQAVGKTTLNQYFPPGVPAAASVTFPSQSDLMFPFDSARDSQLQLSGINTTTLEFSAFFTPSAVVAYPWLTGQQISNLSQPVVLSSDMPGELVVANWALPGGGSRWQMASNGNLAIGTYTVDIPLWNLGNVNSFSASGTMGAGSAAINPQSGRALLYCKAGSNAGGGTVVFTIVNRESTTGALEDPVLASTALAANASSVLRVAPGITAVANLAANDVVGLTPRVKFTIATAAQGFTAALDVF